MHFRHIETSLQIKSSISEHFNDIFDLRYTDKNAVTSVRFVAKLIYYKYEE